jgi:hypothetical protein
VLLTSLQLLAETSVQSDEVLILLHEEPLLKVVWKWLTRESLNPSNCRR